jgi:hypothetical protein
MVPDQSVGAYSYPIDQYTSQVLLEKQHADPHRQSSHDEPTTWFLQQCHGQDDAAPLIAIKTNSFNCILDHQFLSNAV